MVIVIIAVVVVGGISTIYLQGVFNPRKAEEYGQSASLVLGHQDFTSTSPSSSRNGFNWPIQTLFDSQGNLWVADFYNNRVLEFKPPFSTGMNASLVIGQQDFTTANGGGSASTFERPTSLAFDSSGNLWVGEDNGPYGVSRVLEFTPPFKTGMSAALVMGHSQGFFVVEGIMFDSSGNMWIIDSGNNRVLEFVPPFASDMNASIVIGQTNFQSQVPNTTQNGLNSLDGGLAIDQSGDLWVGDAQNSRVLEFKPPFSTGMAASLVIGQPDFTSGPVPSVACQGTYQLGVPHYTFVVFDRQGNLWVSIDCKLEEFKPPFTMGAQDSYELVGGFLSAEGQPVGGQKGILTAPTHVGFDASGNLWVPDTGAGRILEFTPMEP